VGRFSLDLVADSGAMWRLGLRATSHFLFSPLLGRRVRVRATVDQAVRAGWDSVPLVALICFLVGMIMALQAAYQLRTFGAVELVADLVAVSVSRELAPLLAAIIVAGRVGSAIAAELGTMKVSREIDALVVMGIDPVSFLVVPRLVGLMVALPCLTVFADLIGILGGMAVGVWVLELGAGTYVTRTVDSLVLQDLFIGLCKATAFAAIIGLVGCHQGLATRGGAEQVGHATTRAVVRSIVLIVCADLFVTALFFLRG
jgi:phospholipid/cholesterol/gamma-HCH transport system permease protein